MIAALIKKVPRYKWLIAISDLFVLHLSYFVAIKLILFYQNLTPSSYHYLLFIVYSLILLFAMQYNSMYKRRVLFTYINQSVQILKAISYSSIIFILLLYFIRPFGIFIESRMVFIGLNIIPFLMLWIVRTQVVIRVFRSRLIGNMVRENVVIYGASEKGKILAASLDDNRGINTNIMGFVDSNLPRGQKIFREYEVIGSLEDTRELAKDYPITAIYIALDGGTIENLFASIKICSSFCQYVYVSSEILDILPDDVREENIYGSSIVRTNGHKHDFYSIYIKRIIDIIGSSFILICLSPFFIILAILIKISSKGPILFKQTRVGIHRKEFDMYKFRSMVMSDIGEDSRKRQMVEFMTGDNGPNNDKIVSKGRVTRIGSFIRKFSIDELPQLWNVVKGDMSLVGPRPSLPYEAEHYSNWHFTRLEIKPGCTGLWQVSKRYSRSYNDSVILDIYYVQNISVWLDIQILLKTVPAVLFGGRI
jgi:exopolysaccharide biosynthesis polyprenyl glycosylphosphotransferase